MTSEVNKIMWCNNNNCSNVWVILIIILILFGCGGNSCGNNCGCCNNCGCNNNCGCGNNDNCCCN